MSNEERLEQRKQQSQPIVKTFFEFIEAPTFMKGKLKSAVNYMLKLKHSLMKFLDDGRLDISNNLAEQAIRPVAIGRKNWNFSLSERGAESNTIVYSIIQTAAANGLDAYSYIKYLLEKLPQLSEDILSNTLDDLMPWSENMQHHIKHH